MKHKSGYAVALNLNALVGTLLDDLRRTMAHLQPYDEGWTKEELAAIKTLNKAIRELDAASTEAMKLSE